MIKNIVTSALIILIVTVIVLTYWLWTLLKFLVWDRRAFHNMSIDFSPNVVWNDGLIAPLADIWE